MTCRLGDSRLWKVAVAVLVCCYLVPRVADLDTFVQSDEQHWLYRVGNLHLSLVHLDLRGTHQIAHPGITTMWAGLGGFISEAPEYAREFRPSHDWPYNQNINGEIERRLRQLGHDPMDVLVAARVSKLLVQTVLFVSCLFLLRSVFGLITALVFGVLLSFDPFTIGIDQQLHVDGLFAISSLLALLTLARAHWSGPNSILPWILAGAAAALSWLSRLPGTMLALVLVLSIAVRLPRTHGMREHAIVWLRPLPLWGVSSVVVTLALWPAWLVAPIGVLKSVINGTLSMGQYAGPSSGVIFRGTYRDDLGIWYYPIAVLTNSTLAGFIAVGILLIAILIPSVRTSIDKRTLHALGLLSSFFLVYGSSIALATKKYERYALPNHTILYVAGAFGISLLIQFLQTRIIVNRLAPLFAILIVFCIQISTVLPISPIYENYNQTLRSEYFTLEHITNYEMDRSTNLSELVVHVPAGTAASFYILPPDVNVYSDPLASRQIWNETDYVVVTNVAILSAQELDETMSRTYSYLGNFTPIFVEVDSKGRHISWAYSLQEIPAPSWLE